MNESSTEIPQCPAGARLIPLTKNKWAIIDADDFDIIGQYKWCFGGKYAIRAAPRINGRTQVFLMHREINSTPDGFFTDHRNGNRLDNRRNNLRTCTKHQNGCNRSELNKNNSSGVRGVSWHKRARKYRADIMVNRRPIYIGLFDTVAAAESAYDDAAIKLHGEFANI